LKLTNEELECAYGLMCAMADKKKKISDADLGEIAESARQKVSLTTAGRA